MYPDCPAIRRTVRVLGRTRSELAEEFESLCISINALGEKLLASIDFTSIENAYRIDTVELTVHDLGLGNGGTTSELLERARSVGLVVCPLEVGPYLRLDYLTQPEGFWIIIASKPPPDHADAPNGFYLRRIDGELWLRGYMADSKHVWDPDDHFVFRVLSD